MPPTFPDKHRPYLLAMIIAAVFANSFWGVFVFDEYTSITRNEGIHHLWPPDCIFTYPNFSRPVIGVSFAINYAMHQLHFWPYHLFNLLIHVTAALSMYGIVLRTLLSERLHARFSRDAVRLAFLIALIWAIHPLQTASVTYVVQRCESMMGMFFLLALYCVIRSDDSENPGTWFWSAVTFCALGMGCKQVMVTAPLMILLYDRTFLSGSFKAAFQKRGELHAALFATCFVLLTTALEKSTQGPTAGFALKTVTPINYLLTQCAVIPHYIGLSFWPQRLLVDYCWPFATSVREVWPGLALLISLGLASFVATIRNSPWGFLGAWFFVILAPSSSIMPIQDPAFEYRMYLPLAAIVVTCVIASHGLVRASIERGLHPRMAERVSGFSILVIILALSVRTVVRNYDYGLDTRVWKQVADAFPNYQRGANNLGNAYAVEQKHEEAIFWFEKCASINPNYADAQFNLGVEYNTVGRKEDSVRHYLRALEIDPTYENAHGFLADVLIALNRHTEAIPHLEAELKRSPKRDDLRKKLDDCRDKTGDM